jgi:translation elongation factor EF-Ts
MAGYIASYFHHDGTLAAVVEFQCAEASTTGLAEFVAVARDVALHVAVANPTWLSGQEAR